MPAGLRALGQGHAWILSNLLAAVLHVVSPLGVVEGDDESVLSILGFVAFILPALWILLTSINLLISRRGAEGVGSSS